MIKASFHLLAVINPGSAGENGVNAHRLVPYGEWWQASKFNVENNFSFDLSCAYECCLAESCPAGVGAIFAGNPSFVCCVCEFMTPGEF